MRDLNTQRFLIQSLYLQKASGQDVRTHPPMVLLAMVTRRGSWLVAVIACKTCLSLVNDPDDHIRMAHVDHPDVLWGGCIMKFGYEKLKRRLYFIPDRRSSSCLFVWLGHVASGGAEAKKDIYDEPPTLGIPRQYVVAMMAQLFILGFRGAVPYNWRTVPSVSIFSYCETLFLAGDFVSRQQRSFSRALFDCGSSLNKEMSGKKAASSARASEAREKATDKLDVKEFRDRFCIPNGVSVELLNDEVPMPTEKAEGKAILFTKEQFNAGLAARFDKGRGEGTHGGPGWMGGTIGASGQALLSKLHLENPGSGIEGPPCGLGGKDVFCLCLQLFKIDAKERHYKTLISARNLMAIVRESQDYVVNILPRKLPNEEAKEADAEKRRALLEDREKRKNEGIIRKAPGQKRSAPSPPKKAPAKKRRLVKKNGKGVNEPLPPKEFPPPPITHEADVIIEEPMNAAPHSISSGPGRIAGLNHSSTSLAAVAHLANVAEEAASINHPGGSSSKRPRSARNLRSGLLGRLQDRQQEIKVSCASTHDAHPEGGEVEMVTETPAVPVVILDEDAPEETRPIENLVSGLRGMVQQHDLFTDLLRTTDYMKTFASRRKESENQLRLRLAKAEASLSTAQEDNEALRVELAEAQSREDSTVSRLYDTEDEAARLRREVRHLRTEVSIEKKQKEYLQLRLVAQKEELEREFVVEREELEAEYQKQVDDTFIFGYRCCMKKNGIKRDVPSIPPGEEKKLLDKPAP
uniref:Uncharacterized protein n=1 Tax=Vitis vinifera TaxID=29760 RepID=A5C3C7_VITVI|nr:hypothetical protein VITISV_038057 [Vitis vinifera]